MSWLAALLVALLAWIVVPAALLFMHRALLRHQPSVALRIFGATALWAAVTYFYAHGAVFRDDNSRLGTWAALTAYTAASMVQVAYAFSVYKRTRDS